VNSEYDDARFPATSVISFLDAMQARMLWKFCLTVTVVHCVETAEQIESVFRIRLSRPVLHCQGVSIPK